VTKQQILYSGVSRVCSLHSNDPPRASHRCIKLVYCSKLAKYSFAFFHSMSLLCNEQKIISFWGGGQSPPDFFLGFCPWAPLRDFRPPNPVTNTLSKSCIRPFCKGNKSSAVTEMGDRCHNRHGPKREGAAVPLWRGAESPSNTMWSGPRFTAVPSSVFIHPAVWPQ